MGNKFKETIEQTLDFIYEILDKSGPYEQFLTAKETKQVIEMLESVLVEEANFNAARGLK